MKRGGEARLFYKWLRHLQGSGCVSLTPTQRGFRPVEAFFGNVDKAEAERGYCA